MLYLVAEEYMQENPDWGIIKAFYEATSTIRGDGQGVGAYKNNAEAIKWFRKAAMQGYAKAQYNLGVMYANGEGVPEDDAEAANWYRKAAMQGQADAQYSLGVRYANGEGVPEDDAEAVNWFRKAARQGMDKAQFNLGVMYGNGEGVPQDNILAYMWLNLAGAQGSEYATKERKRIANKMTAKQVAEAQRLSRACQALFEEPKLAIQQPEEVLPCESLSGVPDGLTPFSDDGLISPWNLPRRVQ